MAAVVQSISFRDFFGTVANTRLVVDDGADNSTLITAIAACSAAHNNATRGVINSIDDGAKPVSYVALGTVSDKLTLAFKGTGGSNHRYQIPAPLATLFLASNENIVDPANTTFQAARDAILALVVDDDDAPLVSFYRGYRTRRSLKRAPK